MFKNRTRVRAKGLNQERAINNIVKTTKIYNYSRKDHNLSEFELAYSNYKTVKKLVEGQGLEVVSISSRGPIFLIKELFKRGGLIAGLLFVVVFYFLQYSFVLKIEVYGAENIYCSQVKQFIEENLNSRLKHNISTADLEIEVRNNFDFVSSISIALVGQSMVVNLNPSILPNEMGSSFSPLRSNYEGIITKINLVQGTLNCEVGDIVQSGDILVLPYITDASGTLYEVEPRAEIIANVWLNGQECHYDYQIISQRTGRKEIVSQVLLGDLVVYQNLPTLTFLDYEAEETIDYLTKNLLLPLKLKKTVYYEIETKEQIEPFEEVKEQIILKAREKALIFLNKNDIIIEEKYNLSESAGCHIVDYIITVEKNIGG